MLEAAQNSQNSIQDKLKQAQEALERERNRAAEELGAARD
jgi:hypothetical protein